MTEPPPLGFPRPGSVVFECRDCATTVHAFGRENVPEPPLCGLCGWMRENIPDEAERARLRLSVGLGDG